MKVDAQIAEQALLNEDDFIELYPRLRRFGAVVGSREDDPDDLVQDALTRLLAVARQPDDPERYLRRTIVNLVVDRGRRKTRFAARAPKLAQDPARLDRYPSDFDVLDSIAPQERAVLWLADVEGWRFEEIAALFDKRPAAIRKQASRARAALRTHLEGAEDD